jgi:hypothetical protein
VASLDGESTYSNFAAIVLQADTDISRRAWFAKGSPSFIDMQESGLISGGLDVLYFYQLSL